jgi:hypothetical protein
MGKGGQAEAGTEGKAFDPSLVGAFANACPGCSDGACCAPPATTPPEEGSTPASTPPGSAGESTPAPTPPGSPKQQKPRYDKSLKVTTDPVGGKGDPADPVNTEHEWSRCINGLTEACLRGDGASQLLTPSFEYSVPVAKLAKQLTNGMHSIRDDHIEEAKSILDAALESVGGSAEVFERKVYGEEVDQATAEKHIVDFVTQHKLQDKLWVRFTPNRVSCVGSLQRSRRNSQDHPEVRHTLFVSTANKLRKHEVRQFVAHEIGTHLLRVVNDEIQPWRGSSGRKKFNLHSNSTREFRETEEGLATINTVLHSGGGPKSRYLFREALLYYACAKSATMNFVELFAELAPYMPSPKRRFGLVTRIKRGLLDQSLPGGSGKAQVYFEGALTILRRDFDVDDLRLLYSGRLMLSEMDRVRRLAHTSFITLPSFAADLEAYRKDLRAMALLNGLVAPPRKPSLKAVASVALAVATVSPTPPPRRPTPVAAAAPKRAKSPPAASPELATSKLFKKFLAAKKATKKKPAKKRKAAKVSPPTPPAAATTPKGRGDRKPKPAPAATAPPPPRAARRDAAPKLPAVASPKPRPAPARAAKAPPKLPTTPTTPPPPRITTDHWTKAQRWHAKHRNVAVLATTVVELTM